MDTNTYLAKLIERQAREGWSEREMARQMGISPATWVRMKNGTRGMGVDVLQAAMRRFPEYDADALLFLRSDVSNRNGVVAAVKRSVA